MSKRKTVLWLGILVAVLPFLGIPSSWKTAIYLASGIFIAWNSYQLNKHKTLRTKKVVKKSPLMVDAGNIPPSPTVVPSSILREGSVQKKGDSVTSVS